MLAFSSFFAAWLLTSISFIEKTFFSYGCCLGGSQLLNMLIAAKDRSLISVCGWRKGEREEMQDAHFFDDNFGLPAVDMY